MEIISETELIRHLLAENPDLLPAVIKHFEADCRRYDDLWQFIQQQRQELEQEMIAEHQVELLPAIRAMKADIERSRLQNLRENMWTMAGDYYRLTQKLPDGSLTDSEEVL